MKTKLLLGLLALGLLISACTPEELQNDNYKVNRDTLKLEDYYNISTDSTSTTTNDNGFDTGGEDNSKGGD
ncbi:MAG: hypothetical protein ABJQ39_13760 [Winogradskyella arenosi]